MHEMSSRRAGGEREGLRTSTNCSAASVAVPTTSCTAAAAWKEREWTRSV